MPVSGAYNQKMAAIRLILTAEYERLGPTVFFWQFRWSELTYKWLPTIYSQTNPKITLGGIIQVCKVIGCNSEYVWRYGYSNFDSN